MKHFFTLLSLVVIITTANATIRKVTCQNTPAHFLPLTINAMCGDTVRWTWVAGVHVVGPISTTDIPSGAAMWNGQIDVSHHTFDYVVTIAGTYHYDCHPATPHGENATIVVSSTTDVQQYNVLNNLSFYPNPSNGKFQFFIDPSQVTQNCKVEIYNLQGKIIYQSKITNVKSDIDLSQQESGVYLVKFYREQAILTKKIVIE
ncbi:MAG: T9SS type A sorting domain-containing protein [Bacteroidetes bacterium]|nr:T9SS type A sorting domain-containing protein [Bacteroidota bacterium]